MNAQQLGEPPEKSGLSAGAAHTAAWLAQVWAQITASSRHTQVVRGDIRLSAVSVCTVTH